MPHELSLPSQHVFVYVIFVSFLCFALRQVCLRKLGQGCSGPAADERHRRYAQTVRSLSLVPCRLSLVPCPCSVVVVVWLSPFCLFLWLLHSVCFDSMSVCCVVLLQLRCGGSACKHHRPDHGCVRRVWYRSRRAAFGSDCRLHDLRRRVPCIEPHWIGQSWLANDANVIRDYFKVPCGCSIAWHHRWHEFAIVTDRHGPANWVRNGLVRYADATQVVSALSCLGVWDVVVVVVVWTRVYTCTTIVLVPVPVAIAVRSIHFINKLLTK